MAGAPISHSVSIPVDSDTTWADLIVQAQLSGVPESAKPSLHSSRGNQHDYEPAKITFTWTT